MSHLKLINPNLHSTLEFLAGMVDEDKAQEIVEEASRNYFELKQEDPYKKNTLEILNEMDLAYRIMLDQDLSGKKKLSYLLNEVPHLMNKDYFRAFSEKTQNFMLDYTVNTVPAMKKPRWRAWLVAPLLILPIAITYYLGSQKTVDEAKPPLPSQEQSRENNEEGLASSTQRKDYETEELLARGKKECEEMSFSPELIECFRYYAFNKDNRIVELGYEEGFRPREVVASSAPLLGYTHIEKKPVWRLKAEECFNAYPTGGGKVIIAFDSNHFWQLDYTNDEDANNAGRLLNKFCKKKVEDITEEIFPNIKTSPLDKELSGLLGRGRIDCDFITYSIGTIECLKEYLTDEEGVVLISDFRVRRFPDSEDEDSWENDNRLVWELRSRECQKVYDAGTGVVIMELKDGRVWEFKYDYSFMEGNQSKLKTVVEGLQRFCGGL